MGQEKSFGVPLISEIFVAAVKLTIVARSVRWLSIAVVSIMLEFIGSVMAASLATVIAI